ncbi:MAG: hypothetical protein M1820_005253 [Bogoriella megaspora]|nr:MAG: hypothetical protein M1820_005253 [Bogoriella megaspora]
MKTKKLKASSNRGEDTWISKDQPSQDSATKHSVARHGEAPLIKVDVDREPAVQPIEWSTPTAMYDGFTSKYCLNPRSEQSEYPASAFRLMNLPLELRLMVYRFALPAPETLYFNAGITKATIVYPRTDCSNLGILYVSRQVNFEATPILYQRKVFNFENVGIAANFVKRHKECSAHIQSITVRKWKRSRSRAMFNKLKHCTSLQNLILGVNWQHYNHPQAALESIAYDIAQVSIHYFHDGCTIEERESCDGHPKLDILSVTAAENRPKYINDLLLDGDDIAEIKCQMRYLFDDEQFTSNVPSL